MRERHKEILEDIMVLQMYLKETDNVLVKRGYKNLIYILRSTEKNLNNAIRRSEQNG